jgi:hypothetical protein
MGFDAGGETLAVVATLPSRRATRETRPTGPSAARNTQATTHRVATEQPHADVVDARRRHWMQGVPPVSPAHSGGDRADVNLAWEELPGTAILAAWRESRDPSAPMSSWFHDQWTRARVSLEALAQLGSVARSLACDANVPVKACQTLVDTVFRTTGRVSSATTLPVVELDLALMAGDRFGAGPWGEHLFALESALTFRVALERDGRWSREMSAALTGLLLQNLGREFVAKDIPARGLDHARSGAATLAGFAGLSPSIAPIVAYHHQHPAPVFRGGEAGGLRTPQLARGAAAVVRLLELEHVLRPLARRGLSPRDAALDQLVRETEGLRGDRYWSDLLHRTLLGTLGRESATVQFPALASLTDESHDHDTQADHSSRSTGRIDPAAALPTAPHTLVSDPARNLRRIKLNRQHASELAPAQAREEQ